MANTINFESTDVFNNMLVISSAFAVEWRAGALPDAAAAVVIESGNAQLLAAEASFEESSAADALKDESPQLALELHRIESKLNILLKMTGELLAREKNVPSPRLARLSVTGLECIADPGFKVGERGLLNLYVNRSLPNPLVFSAIIESERSDKGQRWVQFRFFDISDSVSDQLERLIFRRHRRLIALSKHS